MPVFDIRTEGDPELFSTVLQTAITLEFPGSTRPSCGTFEAVVHEVIGTKQHRFGPTPPPEDLVPIRGIIRDCMERRVPIPILVPWGASKQGPFSLDIAELMALKQLNCLQTRVRAHYSPGVDFSIRLEDLTDLVLFAGMWPYPAKTLEYRTEFELLHQLVSEPGSTLRKESNMMGWEAFMTTTEQYALAIRHAMKVAPDQREYAIRNSIPGWRGDLPDAQIDYYRRSYSRFYPGESQAAQDTRLATYFATAAARLLLGGVGNHPWGLKPYLTLSFTGVPWGVTGRRIYYRTIPERFTNQHRAPWIGKGYLRVSERSATPAVAGWDGDGLSYLSHTLVISGEPGEVRISADYSVVA